MINLSDKVLIKLSDKILTLLKLNDKVELIQMISEILNELMDKTASAE